MSVQDLNRSCHVYSALALGHPVGESWIYKLEQACNPITVGITETAGPAETIDDVRQIIEQTQPVNVAICNWALFHACRNGRTDIVQLLISMPRVSGYLNLNFGLYQARKYGHKETVNYIVGSC